MKDDIPTIDLPEPPELSDKAVTVTCLVLCFIPIALEWITHALN